MRPVPLLTRTRLAALATGAGACLLLAQAGNAAATPAPTTPAATAASTSTSTSAAPIKPKATAPTTPAGSGPACTTNTDKAYPVVCLPAGSGEDQPASLTPGDDTEFDAQVVNQGSTAVTDASVVITLPQGLRLESDEDDPVYRIDGWYDKDDDGDFTDLTCTGGPSTITCSVGALAAGENILVGIDLEVPRDAQPGTNLTFQVALQPAGTDTYPSTSVSATISVLAPSHLVVSLSPAGLHTVVGHRATVTGTVRNESSDPAPESVAIALDVDPKHPKQTHFVITNGKQLPVEDPSDYPSDGSGEVSVSAVPVAGLATGQTVAVLSARGGSRLRTLLQRHALGRAASVQRHSLPTVAFWPIGTLAPGAVAHVAIQLKAVTVGTDTLTFGAISGDQDCDEYGSESGSSSGSAVPTLATLARAAAASTTTAPADCSFIVQTRITAVAPAATAPLANTGTNGVYTELGLAVWALLLGSLCVWVGRRRLAGRHRL